LYFSAIPVLAQKLVRGAGAIMRKAHKKNQIQDNDNLLTGSKSNE
jgi:hypothetical protein